MQSETTTRLIPLSQGLWTLVDAADYLSLSTYKWTASRGRRESCFYAVRMDHSLHRLVCMHRVILGAPAGKVADHRNFDGLDNRRSNLRLATAAENVRHARPQRNNTSGFKGVFGNTRNGKWVARIGIGDYDQHLGTFAAPVEAAHAYDVAALRIHGEFASLNFP